MNMEIVSNPSGVFWNHKNLILDKFSAGNWDWGSLLLELSCNHIANNLLMWGQQNKLSAVKDVLVKLYIGSIVYIFKSLKLDIFTNKAAG